MMNIVDVLPSEFKAWKNEPIHKSNNSHVYSGKVGEEEAILKIFPFKFPSEETIRSYQKDFEITSILYEKYPKYFSKPIKFGQETNELYTIKTEIGISLDKYISKKKKGENYLDVEEFLKLGSKICEVVHFIHEQNIIHCDLKPQNILFDEKRNLISIIDFESSFLVSLKNPEIKNVERGKQKKKKNL